MKRLQLFKKRKQKAQSMVEFALALPVFLLAVFGVIELSRFFLIYSSVYTASREAARYGASVGFAADGVTPHDQDCAGIQQVALDQGFFAGISNVTVQIQKLDNNLNVSGSPVNCPAQTRMGDRILVQVNTTFQPILGIIPSMPVSASANRTIMKDIDLRGTPPPTLAPATPFPSATANIDPQVIIIDDDPPDDDVLILRNYTTGVKAIYADVIDFNPTNRIHTWTLEGGDAGNVTIQYPHSEDTIVNFSSYGVYGFQLEVFDGQYTGSDTIQVFVNAPPVVNAGGPYSLVGTDGTVCSDGSQFRLTGSASDPFGILFSPAVLQYSWSKPSGTTFDPVAANTLDPKVTFSSPGTYNFTLTANDGYTTTTSDPVSVPVNAPPVVSASVDDDVPDYPAYQVNLSGSATNPDGLPAAGIDAYLWEKVSGPGTVTFTTPTSTSTSATFSERGTYRVRLKASDGCEFGYSSDLTIHVNEIPEVNANTITIQPVLIIPGNALSATISGSVTDDGYPNDPVRLTYKWTGPDNVTIADPNSLLTTISFLSPNFAMPPGSHMLRLTADDGWETAYDEVAVVNNTPPVADAGVDQTIASTASATLNGTATDINLPYQTLTYFWERATGTGTGTGKVSFSNSNIQNPIVSFTGPGTYDLQLTVSDGLASHSDQITITKNGAPVAIATATSNLIRSYESIFLHGETSYDTDTVQSPLTYSWRKESGPGTVTFANTGSTDDDPTASFDVPGAYIIRLRVYDGIEYAYDYVSVQVNAPPTADAGVDQSLNPGIFSTTLIGSGTSDDGIPSGNLTYTWSKYSGPGTAEFSNDAVANPTVTFSTAGVYVLRLTVNDGLESSYDDVTITVTNN